ncbi:hypothetical protein HRED_09697 [Candidatus Haloredivivus sp. G17]|nr:hypothetical protein HRED_09697 [Candidatus Haloredivivus sp. G17]
MILAGYDWKTKDLEKVVDNDVIVADYSLERIFGAFETSVAFVILPFFCKQAYGFLDMYLIHEAEEQM